MPASTPPADRAGFTLIELSLVLVIIGLIVGGVLVGRDLISAAEIRATISQIGKYNSAVNAFRTKYNCLPGDCANAADFGFKPRGQYAGEGDGNGILQGIVADAAGHNGNGYQGAGETAMFWVDLSAAGLIEGGFTVASPNSMPPGAIAGGDISKYLPPAKLGHANYLYVYSMNLPNIGNGYDDGRTADNLPGPMSTNFFGMSGINTIIPNGIVSTYTALTVLQAYNIDQKMDDGMPLSGTVTGAYLNAFVILPQGGGPGLGGSATTCWDNDNGTGAMHYSTEINNGAGINCGLSFRFQ